MVLTTDRADGKQSVLDILQGGARTRVAPFAIIAVVSEASLLLSPGPTSDLDAYLSLLFLALSAAVFLWTLHTLPRQFAIVMPLLYLVSVLFLILAAGGSSAGVGLVVLLPILWAALALDLWESVVIVMAVVLMELVTTYTPVDLATAVRLRREVSFLLVGGLIIFSVQGLRLRIRRSMEVRDSHEMEMSSTIAQLSEQKRITSVINDLVEMLNFCDVAEEAYEVFGFAARQIFVEGGGIFILNKESGLMEPKCSWPVGNTPRYPSPQSSAARWSRVGPTSRTVIIRPALTCLRTEPAEFFAFPSLSIERQLDCW